MKKHEIKIGSHYLARVSGKRVMVRVDAINKPSYESYMLRNRRPSETYAVTNLATGRKLTFRSAAKFLTLSGQKTLAGHEQLTEVVQ